LPPFAWGYDFKVMVTDKRTRGGSLTRPQGRLTLTMGANPSVKHQLLHHLTELDTAA
jgi:hypothetical protein